MNTTYRLNDFRAIVGASVRMVIDVGGWDNSRCINAPGQSGDPRSPHYADLAMYWSRGETVPLLYSAEAIAAAAGLEMELRPPDTQV
jgi:penicillin G amidase